MATCLYLVDTSAALDFHKVTALDVNPDGTCPPSPDSVLISGVPQPIVVSIPVGVSLSPTEYQQIMQAASGMPDPVTGAVIWAAFFGLVLACYVVAKPAGSILALIRDS